MQLTPTDSTISSASLNKWPSRRWPFVKTPKGAAQGSRGTDRRSRAGQGADRISQANASWKSTSEWKTGRPFCSSLMMFLMRMFVSKRRDHATKDR